MWAYVVGGLVATYISYKLVKSTPEEIPSSSSPSTIPPQQILYSCHYCYLNFRNLDERNRHEANYHYICRACHREFPTQSQLSSHSCRATIHFPTPPSTYPHPSPAPATLAPTQRNQPRPSLSPSLSSTHSSSSNLPSPPPSLSTSFSSLSPSPSSPWKCNKCGRNFGSERALNQHFGVAHGWVCEECGRRFVSEGALDQHLRAVHRWECEECGNFFVSKKALDQHFDDEHGQECEECGRIFATEGALNQHYDAVHGWQCGECGKTFRTEQGRDQHEEDVHSVVEYIGDVYMFDCNKRYFGSFRCTPKCRNFWRSAHVWVQNQNLFLYYQQKCKKCETPVRPHDVTPLQPGNSAANKTPHDSGRCFKCIDLGHPCYYDSY